MKKIGKVLAVFAAACVFGASIVSCDIIKDSFKELADDGDDDKTGGGSVDLDEKTLSLLGFMIDDGRSEYEFMEEMGWLEDKDYECPEGYTPLVFDNDLVCAINQDTYQVIYYPGGFYEDLDPITLTVGNCIEGVDGVPLLNDNGEYVYRMVKIHHVPDHGDEWDSFGGIVSKDYREEH